MRHLAVLLTIATLAACDDKASSASVTVVQLSPGDANCPAGGAAFSSGGTTAYACSGAAGTAGNPGDRGEQGIQGLPGLQGIPGGGLYVTRDDVYCDTVSSSVSATGQTLIATCRAAADLPLSGSCSQSDRVDVVLGDSIPADWNAPSTRTLPAEFWCSWTTVAGAVDLNTMPHAKAHICCVTVP